MNYEVTILRDDLADVVARPCWLFRLFGRKGWKRRAARTVEAWRWASSAELVPASIAGAIWIALDDVTSRFSSL